MKQGLASGQPSPVALAKAAPKTLLSDVRGLILRAREGVAHTVNASLTWLYWQIGRRVRRDVLREKRARYGERIVAALGRELEREFGRGFNEKDLESAILREMESFILELGTGFCFVARQKRMQIDDEDYHLDLLFYHRKLRRLVAIDLKLRNFEAGDKGQMELYLSWLRRNECQPGEAAPLGIILCAGRRGQHVELLELEKSRIHVASYWTQMLPRRLLERKLCDAVRLARAQLESREGSP